MLKICIVDDDSKDRAVLVDYINRYQEEMHEAISVKTYKNGLKFISEYDASYDLIFFDIEMPHMDGLEAAHRLRHMDQTVGIIFVTNVGQYAIKGYEVEAIDFIVKPVTYYVFLEKFKKALRLLKGHQKSETLIDYGDGIVKMPLADILYIEKDKNYIVYHTSIGNKSYRARGTLKAIENQFLEEGFLKNTSGCLVNPKHIYKINGDLITIGDVQLTISRNRKKQFMGDYLDYLGGRI